MQTEPCTREVKLEHSVVFKKKIKSKSGLMSVFLTKLFFDKGISEDKCCCCPI